KSANFSYLNNRHLLFYSIKSKQPLRVTKAEAQREGGRNCLLQCICSCLCRGKVAAGAGTAI
ncbi:hypothetical protein, partial [uncultured Pontibacter sp.]|uniref:hypothetical protein n=1 Tax=uncultured Pontibacter sp. TaxID=453356 RepID=UPI002611C8AE